MKHNNDFRYDLKIGQIAENKLAELLENEKIEVKRDLQASKTGNFFIEYESRGKPSGVSTSESKWYALIPSDDIIILTTSERLKSITRSYLGSKRDVRGGDSNTSKGILLPVKSLI